MAYRKSKGKLARRTKIQPAVQTLTFAIPEGVSYIDIALAASIANRRGYKQQNTDWAVGNMTFYAAGSGGLSIWKIPETWVVDNAYVKSHAMWNKMNEQVLEDEPDIQGTYADFKINIDSSMVGQTIQCEQNPLGRILTPLTEAAPGGVGTGLIQIPGVGTTNSLTTADFTAAVSPRADWNYSTIQIPNDPASGTTTEYALHMVGPDTVTSKGLIEGYARSRTRPHETDPNVPLGEGWMNELFDVGENNEEIRDDLVDDNDRPPYANFGTATVREAYPGGSEEQMGLQSHAAALVTTSTIGGTTNISGGFFKAGLMKLNNTVGVGLLQIHLVPGSHRGYMC